MYCIAALEGPLKVSFKCDDEDFSILTERENIIPAPYMARNKWVTIKNPNALNKEEWKYFISKSYELIAMKLPKKVQQKIKFTIIRR